jgi:hypothetical protein
MKKNAEIFLNKTLGKDFLESLGTSLSKSEVYKQGTRTITDTTDLYQGLQIVPKALLSLLIRELSPMQIGDTKEIKIPGKEDTIVSATKHERDSYSGQIIQNNVKIADFLHRSAPGLGLVLLTVLELYDIEDLDKEHNVDAAKEAEINHIIDERMNLHSLVNKVVDGKLMQRDAVQQLFMSKLNQLSHEHQQIKEEHKEIIQPKEEPKPVVIVLAPKKRPLADFVENRKKKLDKKEHFIQLEKSETVSCSDCGQNIFSNGMYSGCICYGEDNKKLYIKKSEGGYNIKFGRGWDVENIEMLLEVLRSKKNG